MTFQPIFVISITAAIRGTTTLLLQLPVDLLDHPTIFGDDSSSGDDNSHPEEGDSFMYADKSDDAAVSMNNSNAKLAGESKSRSSSCSESSFASDDYRVASLSSTICQSIVLDFADSTSEEHDSDASSLNGLTLAWLTFITR
jgi:hypothetical protein